jgi:hypothetical protein
VLLIETISCFIVRTLKCVGGEANVDAEYAQAEKLLQKVEKAKEHADKTKEKKAAEKRRRDGLSAAERAAKDLEK